MSTNTKITSPSNPDESKSSPTIPVTGETTRLTPTPDMSMQASFWPYLSDVGIRLRPDFRRPEYWVAAVMTHQTSAYPTREDATLAAIRWLVEEVHRQQTAREAAEARNGWGNFFR